MGNWPPKPANIYIYIHMKERKESKREKEKKGEKSKKVKEERKGRKNGGRQREAGKRKRGNRGKTPPHQCGTNAKNVHAHESSSSASWLLSSSSW